LVAGVAFAVDLGGTVIGVVDVINADSDGSVNADGSMSRIRLEGGGEVADGKFGGWLRFSPQNVAFGGSDGNVGTAAIAWWKPIDQLKVGIGGNPDGIWGKEGNSGWMFYQHAADTNVTFDGQNVWGAPQGWAPINVGIKTRQAFYEGFGDNRLFIEIRPVDMVGINIGIPFITHAGDVKDVFLGTHAQIDLNLSFGNIAFSYAGDAGDIKKGQIFAYFGLTAIDNLQMDFGLGTDFQDTPLNFGLAVKYSGSSWGIKFRTMFAIPINSDQPFGLLFDILPYFVINDSFRAYISGGIAIGDAKNFDSSLLSWHVNPYIEIGEEWGPKFLAGIKVYQRLGTTADADDNYVHFAIPLALVVSF